MKLIHIMLRVLDEKRSVDFYKGAFGLTVSYSLDFEKFKLIYLRNNANDVEIELTVNKDRAEPYNLGDGYGHVAFCVDNLAAEHKRFVDSGYNPRDIVEFARDGEHVASFFFVKDPDGYEIEVLQRSGHYQ